LKKLKINYLLIGIVTLLLAVALWPSIPWFGKAENRIAAIQERGELRVSTLNSPLIYSDINGKIIGLDYELAQQFADYLGVTLDPDAAVEIPAVEKQTAAIKERKRILFVLSTQGGKILAAGSDSAADGIIKLAGAVNAVEGFSGYKSMTDEAIATARPDVILTMKNAGPPISKDELFANPAVASTPAGVARKVIVMDGGYLLGFGPRTAEAIHDLAVSLYGNQVTD